MTDEPKGDGVALFATNHPLLITDEMVAAGLKAFGTTWKGGTVEFPSMVKAIYEAMVYAAPPELELDEDSLKESVLTVELRPEQLEAYAIRCARGNNGGEWATHYTENQKEHWREFVRNLFSDMLALRFDQFQVSLEDAP